MHPIMASVTFGIVYVLIATERMDKTIAALLGASAMIICHVAPYDEILRHVDLNVIFLLVGMMIMVNILGTTGVFEWVAVMIAKKTRGNAVLIVILMLVVTAGLSAFLDNVTTILLIAPVTILITQILEIPTVPFLIMEAIFSNIGGTATLVGDPPNILIGSGANLHFNAFLVNLGPIVLLILVLSVVLLTVLLRGRLKVSQLSRNRIMKTKPWKAITRPRILKRALPIMALVLAGFFLGRFLEVEPGIIALAGAGLMAAFCKVDVHSAIQKVEWATILFFLGLFLMVGALEANGTFQFLAHEVISLTRGNLFLTVSAILWFAGILSALVDNIPLVIGMIPLIQGIVPGFIEALPPGTPEAVVQAEVVAPLFWALALGACLGGNGSLVGASANVIVGQIAVRNKYKLSFWEFTKYGFPVMLATLLLSNIYLYMRYFR